MEWFQYITLMGTIIAAAFAFYKLTAERIDNLEDYHREDLKKMDNRLKLMDEKWERLFERLLIQDKK
jgi:hypothetical protein